MTVAGVAPLDAVAVPVGGLGGGACQGFCIKDLSEYPFHAPDRPAPASQADLRPREAQLPPSAGRSTVHRATIDTMPQ